jgi:hypothetical protein
VATKNAILTAQSAVAAPATKFGDFKPIVGTTGSILYVLENGANQPASMKHLEDAGLMPFEEKEILSILIKDKQLKNFLKGKWFYLAGSGTDKGGLYTINEDGSLAKGKGKSIENTVRVWSGDKPLSLDVYSDGGTAYCGGRFLLNADDDPALVAPVVVGKPKLNLNEPAEVLLKEIEVATGNLRRSATHEDLMEKANGLTAKVAELTKLLRPTQI